MTQPNPEALKSAILFLEGFPGLDAALQGDHIITKDLRNALFNYGSLSDSQVKLAFDVHSEVEDALSRIARAREADDPRTPLALEHERRKIIGTVISTKLQNSEYGPQAKMLVEEITGNRLYGTVPTRLRARVEAGERVRFDAEIKPSDDDPHFGFFKRPTNAELLAPAQSDEPQSAE